MERNLLLTVEYDGTMFHGWQRQPGQVTVQGELERVLSVLCGRDVEISGTSRTDAGVHALDQKATLRGDFGIPTDRIALAANNLIEGSVRILDVKEMPPGFHARFDCVKKTYKYVMSREKTVFDRNHKWQTEERPEISLMREAAEYIKGTHDFACFQAAGGAPRETTVRTVFSLDISQDETDTEIFITGDGFLYNMVRIIAGTLYEAGTGKRKPLSVKEAIEAKDRSMAGLTAPPQGLYLAKVYFEREMI